VFLGAYEFDGDPVALTAAYDRLVAGYPPDALLVHVCVVGEDGITVYDACPSPAVFDAFSTSPEFSEAVRAAGLPTPRVVRLGHVHRARQREDVG
jgi:hypothetical protein